MTDQPTGDFDGCNSECRKAGKHSLRWGGCEHATPPEPTVSMSVVYTDPTDGYPAIGFDTYTVPQLAELIEPALNATALRAWRKPSEVAAEVARAIVHRHDEERPAVPVSSPPPDQTADRAAVLLWAADQIDAETRQAKADGVLEPDKFRPCRDASAQLRALAGCQECASGLEHDVHCPTPETHNWGCGCPSDVAAAIASCPGYETKGPSPCRCPCYGCKHHCGAHDPSRLAAEAQQPEAGADLIEDYLRFLRRQGPEPDLTHLTPDQRKAVTGQFEIVRALADRDPNLPPLDRDPVARRLGLHATAEAPQPEADDTDLTESDIDRLMAAGVPVQIVAAPPDTHGAEAQQPDTGDGDEQSDGPTWSDTCPHCKRWYTTSEPGAHEAACPMRPAPESPAHIGGNADDCPACQTDGLDTIGPPYECPGDETADEGSEETQS